MTRDQLHATNSMLYVKCIPRGIGLGLVRKFLARDNCVIATGRKTAEAAQLQELRQQYGPERLLLTDLDASRQDSVVAWARGVKGLTQHVDVRRGRGAGGRKQQWEAGQGGGGRALFACRQPTYTLRWNHCR